LNTGPYRTVLRRDVSRRLTPEPSRLDIGLTVIDRSWGAWPGSSDFRLPFVFVEG
jgi:hypothetical protein